MTVPGQDVRKLRDIAMTRRSLVSPAVLVKALGIFVIPVAAGIMLLFFDPALVAIVTVALYASLWFLLKPFPALLVFMLLVAVRPQEGIAQLEAIHVERLFGVLALLGWGLQAAMEKTPVSLPRGVAGWLFAFVVVCFGSIFTSFWKLGAVDGWIELLKAVALFFLVSQLVNGPKRLVIFLAVFGLGHLWMAGESLRLYYSEGYDYIRMGITRATTLSESRGDPNSLAASLLLAVCFGIYTMRARASVLWRLIWAGVICAGSFVVVLTGSRAAMLAALLMLFYVWLRSRQKLLVAAGVVVIVAAVWLAMPLQYKDRFITTFDLERNPSAAESARGRITGLKVGAEMFFDRPLLGVGIGNFSAAHAMLYSPSGSRSWLQAHNLLAQVAGETGLLGVIAFAGFVIASMRLAGRLSSTPRSALPGWAHGLPVNAGAQQLPGSVSLIGSDDSSFVSSTARAALACIWLLLFLGLFAHNLLRFNWYLNAGLISACGAMMPSLGAGHEKKRVDLRPPRAELPRAETPEV